MGAGMSSAWGDSWDDAWEGTWGPITVTPVEGPFEIVARQSYAPPVVQQSYSAPVEAIESRPVS